MRGFSRLLALTFVMPSGCSAPEDPKSHGLRGPSSEDTKDGGSDDGEGADTETGSDMGFQPLGSQWEEARRRALAGCEQTASSSLTGATYAVNEFDRWGWLVTKRLYSGGDVTGEVHTTYRREEGRVVSSEVVREVGAGADTGCDAGTETVRTEYDVAQRPVHVSATTEACGATSVQETTIEYTVEDDVLIDSFTYQDDKLLTYTDYDRCAMRKHVGDAKYRNHYLEDCELDYVEYRRFGWFWFYEGQRPVRYTVEGADNDTLFSYRDCESG